MKSKANLGRDAEYEIRACEAWDEDVMTGFQKNSDGDWVAKRCQAPKPDQLPYLRSWAE